MKKMSIGVVLFTVILLSIAACTSTQQDTGEPAYKNPNLSVEERVDDLLGRMTLEEKVAQIRCAYNVPNLYEEGTHTIVTETMEQLFPDGMGRIERLIMDLEPREAALHANALQKYLVEETRLGIPAILNGEGLHGHMARDATTFPMSVGLASTWDPALHEEIFTAVAKEMRAVGIHQILGPVLGLARDPRFGRVEEMLGEDPWLVSEMGMAAVRGYQGVPALSDPDRIISTVKHFAVYSQPEHGINYSPGNFSERVIRENFLLPFEKTIKEAGALSVMAAYQEIDGIPAHANRWLLTDVLRDEWGFEGVVVADWNGIEMLMSRHYVAADIKDAVKQALEAGVDMDLPNGDPYGNLVEMVAEGMVSEAEIEKAVKRELTLKFKIGLFENPYIDPDRASEIVNSDEHKELARKAAEKTMVLLKNEKNLLPLDVNKIKSIAVIGPNASGPHHGGYSYEPRVGTGILEGIQAKVGDQIQVNYALGCKITENVPGWNEYEVVFPDPEENRRLIREAVTVARRSDVALLVIGGNESTCREAWENDHPGDRNSIEMLGEQNELVQAILATGKPVIVFLINGRPLAINEVAETVPAIVECWYLGQEGGHAAADVLFGDVNPGGKLPITFPRSTGHIPAYYNHKPATDQDYLWEERTPLFPFGYGLSYTTFEYGAPSVSPVSIPVNGSTTVSVDVKNTGDRAGDEVVQLYIRDEVSSVTRPVKELRGFKRITLEPGESQTVSFEITPDMLQFYDREMNRVVEPGTFNIMVGGNSVDIDTVNVEVVQK
ncbi:glycoside hydrolase family 3 N-terminal domain-containing protein [Candidatus Latescibacterota bacterium]